MSIAEPRWRRLFAAALTELDAEKFTARLTAADDAVFYRLLELEDRPDMGEERTELEEALEDLRLLRSNCYLFGKEAQ
jgi:hypothetical protein